MDRLLGIHKQLEKKNERDSGDLKRTIFSPESELNSQDLNLFLLTLLLYNTDLTDSTRSALHLVETKVRIGYCLSILVDRISTD